MTDQEIKQYLINRVINDDKSDVLINAINRKFEQTEDYIEKLPSIFQKESIKIKARINVGKKFPFTKNEDLNIQEPEPKRTFDSKNIKCERK